MKKLIAVSTLALLVGILSGCGVNNSHQQYKNNALKETYTNQNFEVVGVDMADSTTSLVTVKNKQTGCVFLVTSSSRSTSAGTSPIQVLNADGKPMCGK